MQKNTIQKIQFQLVTQLWIQQHMEDSRWWILPLPCKLYPISKARRQRLVDILNHCCPHCSHWHKNSSALHCVQCQEVQYQFELNQQECVATNRLDPNVHLTFPSQQICTLLQAIPKHTYPFDPSDLLIHAIVLPRALVPKLERFFVRPLQLVCAKQPLPLGKIQKCAIACLQSVQNILKGDSSRKHGWIYQHMLGKQTNQVALAVGEPSTWLAPNELGLPRRLSQMLTRKVLVTQANISELWHLAKQDQIRHVVHNGIVHTLHSPKILPFQVGDEVHRCLQDGDGVLINRPPSLSNQSMLYCTIRVVDAPVLYLHPWLAEALDGDFDGDLYRIQNTDREDSHLEQKQRMRPEQNICNRMDGFPTMGLTDDVLWTLYAVWNKPVQALQTQPPAFYLQGKPQWVGKQLLHFPADFCWRSKRHVLVYKGKVYGSDALSSSEWKEMLRHMTHLYPPSVVLEFLANTMKLLRQVPLAASIHALDLITGSERLQDMKASGVLSKPITFAPYLRGLNDQEWFASCVEARTQLQQTHMELPVLGKFALTLTKHVANWETRGQEVYNRATSQATTLVNLLHPSRSFVWKPDSSSSICSKFATPEERERELQALKACTPDLLAISVPLDLTQVFPLLHANTAMSTCTELLDWLDEILCTLSVPLQYYLRRSFCSYQVLDCRQWSIEQVRFVFATYFVPALQHATVGPHELIGIQAAQSLVQPLTKLTLQKAKHGLTHHLYRSVFECLDVKPLFQTPPSKDMAKYQLYVAVRADTQAEDVDVWKVSNDEPCRRQYVRARALQKMFQPISSHHLFQHVEAIGPDTHPHDFVFAKHATLAFQLFVQLEELKRTAFPLLQLAQRLEQWFQTQYHEQWVVTPSFYATNALVLVPPSPRKCGSYLDKEVAILTPFKKWKERKQYADDDEVLFAIGLRLLARLRRRCVCKPISFLQSQLCKTNNQWGVLVQGSDLQQVLKHVPFVDPNGSFTTNPWVCLSLHEEKTMVFLQNLVLQTFEALHISVHPVHVQVLLFSCFTKSTRLFDQMVHGNLLKCLDMAALEHKSEEVAGVHDSLWFHQWQ